MTHRKSAIKSVDVHDLPEPVAAMLQSMAQVYRSQSTRGRKVNRLLINDRPPSAGHLLTGISRSEIYEDVV